jgi:hypothetical protein
MRRLSVLSAVLLALAAGPAAAQEMIENGEFTSWNKFKKGTSITTKVSSTAGGMASEATMTVTLVDVGADKLVLETTGVTKAMGMEFKQPAVKRDVPRTVALPKGAPKPPAPGSKPEGTYEEGTETLKVAGTEVKTKWYKVKAEMGGIKSDAKMWVSEDMPGMMVKVEATTTGTVASETKMEVVEVKKP